MGGAVKAVTSVVKKPTTVLSGGAIPMNQALLKKGGLSPQGLLDSMRGKYKVPDVQVQPNYKLNAKVYQASKGQRALLDALKKKATGKIDVSNSIAQQQLQQGTNRNLAQLAGAVAGARGPNQALAMRAGLQNQAAAAQEMAGQSGLLRAQEYQQALQNQQTAVNQLMQAQSENQRMREAGEAQRVGIAGAGQQANLQAQLGRMGAQAQANQSKAAGEKDLIGNVVGGAMKIFSGSDKNIKKNIKPAALEEIMTKINASKFKYKHPNGEPYQDGEVFGVMAQDLEKSKLGKEMVVDSEDGKQVDLKKAVPVTMAAVSEIMKRIKALEKKA